MRDIPPSSHGRNSCRHLIDVLVAMWVYSRWSEGDIAQLGERYNRTVEVGGSSPPVSTLHRQKRSARFGGAFLSARHHDAPRRTPGIRCTRRHVCVAPSPPVIPSDHLSRDLFRGAPSKRDPSTTLGMTGGALEVTGTMSVARTLPRSVIRLDTARETGRRPPRKVKGRR